MSALPDGDETPWQRYRHDLTREGFVADAAQERAVARLQRLYEDLVRRGSRGGLGGLIGRLRRRPPPPGLYLWGGVGRGKTYLMDCFYECLPLAAKRRVHFHRFMEDVHDRLATVGDAPDPLVTVARALADETRVLCFDEFFVADIADAMILGGLLESLFKAGVTLVATSNTPPERLYHDGLQRARFLPAIALIQSHTEVIHLDGGVDYRLRILDRAEIYHHPLDADADRVLRRNFCDLTPGKFTEGSVIHVNHRELRTVAVADGIVWLDFAELCEAPRGPADYIELARRFNTVLVANVPRMADGMNDPARRFINFVDEMYDRNVNLIMSAQTEIQRLYGGTRLEFEFRRTISRLNEMQTHDYLSREHRP